MFLAQGRWPWTDEMVKMANKDVVERAELRKFGYVMAGFFGLVVGALLPWWWSLKWAYWPWLVAALFLVLAILWPSALGGVHRVWMRLARVLEWINTRIVLGVVFFLVFTPLGFLMRMLRRDTLKKAWDRSAVTYRTDRQARKENHMERQF